MKIIMDRKGEYSAKRVRIETGDFVFDLNICKITGNLVVNKVDGIDGDNKISIYSRYSNEIELR